MRRFQVGACSVAALSPFFVWLAMTSACGKDRADAHCTPDDPSYEGGGRCIFSADGEASSNADEGPCVPDDADAGVPTKPATCPTDDEVWTFFTDPARGNCTASACHGNATNPSGGIYFNANDRSEMYIVMTSTLGTVGTPYVEPGDSAYEASWIVCSLISKKGGGIPMPPQSGLPNYDDAQVIRDWLLCGANGPQ